MQTYQTSLVDALDEDDPDPDLRKDFLDKIFKRDPDGFYTLKTVDISLGPRLTSIESYL